MVDDVCGGADDVDDEVDDEEEVVEAVEFVVEEDGAVGTGAFESGLNVVDGEFRASWGAATELVVGFEVG